MTRLPLAPFALLFVLGCSPPPPAPAPIVPAPAPAKLIPDDELPPAATPAEAKPLLTPEPPANVKPAPRDATVQVPFYSYPASYKPLHHGPTLAPEPIPVLPTRKPARVLGDLRFYCRGGVAAIAASPDGKLLACSSAPGGIRLFDTATGKELVAFHGHFRAFTRVAFSPDSTRLYSGDGQGSLVAWDIAAKQEVIALPAADWSLTPDGRTLITLEWVSDDPPPNGKPSHGASSRPVVRVRDTGNWAELAGYAVNGLHPTAVAVSPDANVFALGGRDGIVRTWDRRAGKELARLADLTIPPAAVPPEHYKSAVVRLLFDATGKRLAGANRDGPGSSVVQVAVWDWPPGPPARRWTMNGTSVNVLFAPDGKHLVATGGSRAAVWDIPTGGAGADTNIHVHGRTFSAAAFAPGADRLYVAGQSPRVGTVAFPTLAMVSIADPPPDDGLPKLPFETAGPIPMSDDRSEVRLPDGGRVRGLDLHKDRAGFGHFDAGGKRVRVYESGRAGPYDVTADGKLLVTSASSIEYGAYDYAKWENPIRFWDLATGNEVGVIRVYPKAEGALRFSPDGNCLAVRHHDGLVRIWDVATRKPLLALDPDGYCYWPSRLTFSKDGKSLAAGDDKSPVLVVWDVTDPVLR